MKGDLESQRDIHKISNQADEAAQIMSRNLVLMFERGEKLEETVVRTEALQQQAKQFKSNSKVVCKKEFLKKFKYQCCIISGVTVLLVVIILVAVVVQGSLKIQT